MATGRFNIKFKAWYLLQCVHCRRTSALYLLYQGFSVCDPWRYITDPLGGRLYGAFSFQSEQFCSCPALCIGVLYWLCLLGKSGSAAKIVTNTPPLNNNTTTVLHNASLACGDASNDWVQKALRTLRPSEQSSFNAEFTELRHLLAKPQLPFTACFLGSLASVLYWLLFRFCLLRWWQHLLGGNWIMSQICLSKHSLSMNIWSEFEYCVGFSWFFCVK